MPLPVSDDFNRANNDSLGANWQESEPTLPSDQRILANQLRVTTANFSYARWSNLADVFPADQYSQATLMANNLVFPDQQRVGLAVRLGIPPTDRRGYGFIRETVAGAGRLRLIYWDDVIPASATLAEEVNEFGIGQAIRVTMIGTTLRGYLFIAGAWSLRLTAVHAAIASGQPGFVSRSGTVTYFVDWDLFVADAGDGFSTGAEHSGKRKRMGLLTGGRRIRRGGVLIRP